VIIKAFQETKYFPGFLFILKCHLLFLSIFREIPFSPVGAVPLFLIPSGEKNISKNPGDHSKSNFHVALKIISIG